MRRVNIQRKTKETEVSVELNLDGSGKNDIQTSIPFLDHMLDLFSFHGGFDLKIQATGDIQIDYHHLMEDLGITIGQALKQALGDKKGIERYGIATVPMDESLARVVIDLSGRPYLVYNFEPPRGALRDLEVSLFEEFFRALSNHAMMNLHMTVEYGKDLHHMVEALFKACGRALRQAVSLNPGRKGIPTTKGKL
ncbi:MAG TPA: imidazoleglycerol-phosphate dehydratase HisB [Dissulfurispiraceae bacterium]|nr:imidazoleglycerol-phosphate dehydratase HisB [Dissulfurispiraceae bacterium]